MRLADLSGFAFDLDGCVWTGAVLLPGAADLLAALRRRGKRAVFLTNNSRELPESVARKLCDLGVEASPREVLTALDLVGGEIARRFGRTEVLVLGVEEMTRALKAHGHRLVPLERWRDARVVAVGNDPAFDYAKLKAASQAVARGAHFVTVNLDPTLPLEKGEFDPGAGALAEAVAVASGVRPLVIGKPRPLIFRTALERLGCRPREAAMIGDSLRSDIRGGRAAGMFTVWVVPPGAKRQGGIRPHLRVASLTELHALLEEGVSIRRRRQFPSTRG
ncbi:MAG: HAD-IIA family hydrolase [Candidatus Rokubacteria bacterium]|nr:HAD-IIA family hydrolase [Candidatus Rokubacteria bacterium]